MVYPIKPYDINIALEAISKPDCGMDAAVGLTKDVLTACLGNNFQSDITPVCIRLSVIFTKIVKKSATGQTLDNRQTG
jgi:hypothetical protein